MNSRLLITRSNFKAFITSTRLCRTTTDAIAGKPEVESESSNKSVIDDLDHSKNLYADTQNFRTIQKTTSYIGADFSDNFDSAKTPPSESYKHRWTAQLQEIEIRNPVRLKNKRGSRESMTLEDEWVLF